jgi:hypothetical protein
MQSAGRVRTQLLYATFSGVGWLLVDVPLFELVPWTHGYAHSWALRWLLLNDPAPRDVLLGLFLPERVPPWTLESVTREFRVDRHRADLCLLASDSSGRANVVLIETKVNDALSECQVRTYCDATADVILYGPGLTGLLHGASEPIACERWVTGRQVADALTGLELPDLIRSYLSEVACQADRMDAARAAARGERPGFDHTDDVSEVSADDVEAVAWVAEVAAAMRAAGAADVRTRDTAYDYGVFWGGSWQPIKPGGDLGVYVDVIAAHGGREYAITIKVGGGEADDRRTIFDAAMRAGEPWGGWLRGRRLNAATFRLWKLDASAMTAPQAADATLRITDYLSALAEA